MWRGPSKTLRGYDKPAATPRIPLDPELFEYKLLHVEDVNPSSTRLRAKVAYYSRNSNTIVFLNGYKVTITNDPEQIARDESPLLE